MGSIQPNLGSVFVIDLLPFAVRKADANRLIPEMTLPASLLRQDEKSLIETRVFGINKL